jgi:hypothetical protein
MSQINLTVDAWIDEYTREDTMRQWLEGVAREGFWCQLSTGERRFQTLDVKIREVTPAESAAPPWPLSDPELVQAMMRWAMSKGAIITREWFGLLPAEDTAEDQETTA